MKTSAVLASLLFGSFAVAAPVDRRDLVLKTEVLWETVVVYTTVYDDDNNVAEATTTPAGYFYEQPPKPTSVAAKATTPAPAPVNTPAPVEKPSSKAPAPAPAPAPSSSAAPVEQPKPATSAYVAPSSAPAPAPAPAAPTSAYVAPAPAASSPAPAASSPAPQAPSGGSPSGQTYSNVDMTVYDAEGYGACGAMLSSANNAQAVALSHVAFGASTYDVMTGAATNKWCGQKIKIKYGNQPEVDGVIMDMCPGCSGNDIDLSRALWAKAYGSDEATRVKASWYPVN